MKNKIVDYDPNQGDLNLIELLKQALLFYAKKENYIEKPMNDGLISMVEIDDGSQARFALEQIKKVKELNEGIDNDYLNYVSEESTKQETPEGILNLMKEIKRVGDENI